MRFPALIAVFLILIAFTAGCLFEKDAIVGSYSTDPRTYAQGGTLAVFNTSGTFYVGSPPYQGLTNGTWNRIDAGEVQLAWKNGVKENVVCGDKKGVFLAREIIVKGIRFTRIG
ncbi:MAG TPA: hypothetical protein VMB35_09705 [Methanomicrobiales archaeon]|nr:hypothetical protein [Methanomicrobiales archaeon]